MTPATNASALRPEVDRLIAQWQQARQAYDTAKAEEYRLRSFLVASLFDQRKTEGTETIVISHGFKLKAIKSMRYCFVSAHHASEAVITLAERFGMEGQFIANRLVKWCPEFVVSEWRRMTPEQQAIIVPHITVREASPQLQLIEPK